MPFKLRYHVVNVGDLGAALRGRRARSTSTRSRRVGLAPKKAKFLKILGWGEARPRCLTITAHAVSEGARKKIEARLRQSVTLAPDAARAASARRQEARVREVGRRRAPRRSRDRRNPQHLPGPRDPVEAPASRSGFLLVYRIGWNIPLPGIDLAAHARTPCGEGEEGTFAALYSLISGGGIYSFALFSLGIMPYISSSIIFSLLTKVVPSLEAIAKEGAAGQRKINQWTRLATVPIALLQAMIVVTNVYTQPGAVIADARRCSRAASGWPCQRRPRPDRRLRPADVDRRADHRVRRRQRHLAPHHGRHHRPRPGRGRRPDGADARRTFLPFVLRGALLRDRRGASSTSRRACGRSPCSTRS